MTEPTSRTGNLLNQWNRIGAESTDKPTTTVQPLPPVTKTKPPGPPTVTFPKIPQPVPSFQPVPAVRGSNPAPVRTVCGSATGTSSTKSRVHTSGGGGPCDLCKCF